MSLKAEGASGKGFFGEVVQIYWAEEGLGKEEPLCGMQRKRGGPCRDGGSSDHRTVQDEAFKTPSNLQITLYLNVFSVRPIWIYAL